MVLRRPRTRAGCVAERGGLCFIVSPLPSEGLTVLYYSTAIPMLVGRQFGDEVVVANYETGFYYSLTGTGADIWLGLGFGHSVDEVIAALSHAYPADAERIPEHVNNFIVRLAADGLVVPHDAPERQDWSPTLGGAFTEPVLEEFDDLKDLLLLDPVHDVAEAGWPVRMDDQSET